MLASSLLRSISYNKNLTKHSIRLFSRVLSSSTAATNMSQAEATSTSTESNPKTSENKEPIRLRKKIIVFGGAYSEMFSADLLLFCQEMGSLVKEW